ncbi:MAG: ISNCY family transposase, partial [Candidatus Komeilibacteria bacterium]|nr:ISNCY family transposase [Candidatus Komeilibacteria bacterium]
MSQKEIKRYHVIKKLLNREFNGSAAAVILKLSVRHIRRLKNKVRQAGAKGLTHGSRGRASNRKIPDQIRDKIIKLLQEKYYDFGPGLVAEKLAKNHGINHDPKTIRQIMIGEELWRPRKARSGSNKEHREWRQRKANYGEMIQYDGSYEHWFEDRSDSGEVCLLAAIDDATGKLISLKFAEHEGVEPTFGFWKEYIVKNGKPYSIYVDKFSTYSMNHQTAKENENALTQFKRAMEKDLQIEVITANSPQAKGRVERLFKTLQDRLIKELRLNHISGAEAANEFLEKIFLPEFNARFAVEPRGKADLHQKLIVIERDKFDSIF